MRLQAIPIVKPHLFTYYTYGRFYSQYYCVCVYIPSYLMANHTTTFHGQYNLFIWCTVLTYKVNPINTNTHSIPWSLGSDCPDLRCLRRFPVELSPPSLLSPEGLCHPSAPQWQHAPFTPKTKYFIAGRGRWVCYPITQYRRIFLPGKTYYAEGILSTNGSSCSNVSYLVVEEYRAARL